MDSCSHHLAMVDPCTVICVCVCKYCTYHKASTMYIFIKHLHEFTHSYFRVTEKEKEKENSQRETKFQLKEKVCGCKLTTAGGISWQTQIQKQGIEL